MPHRGIGPGVAVSFDRGYDVPLLVALAELLPHRSPTRAPAQGCAAPALERLETRSLPSVTVTDLGTFGGPTADAFGINDAGQVAGYADTPVQVGTAYVPRAFRYCAGVLTDLGALPGDYASKAFAINAAGEVVGSSGTVELNPMTGDWAYRPVHAFLWDPAGGMRDLGYLPGHDSSAEAYALNDRGRVVGVSRAAPPQANGHAFLWQNGVMVDLGNQGGGLESHAFGISDAGLVAGDACFSDTYTAPPHAFALALAKPLGQLDNLSALLGDPPPASSRVYGVNASGVRVGTYGSHDPGRGFVLDADDTLTTLPPYVPGGDQYSIAYAVNASGQVVGASGVSSPPPFRGVHGFFWDRASGMHILTNLVSDVRWAVTSANAINGDGIIAGHGTYNSGSMRAIEVTFDIPPSASVEAPLPFALDPLVAPIVWPGPQAVGDRGAKPLAVPGRDGVRPSAVLPESAPQPSAGDGLRLAPGPGARDSLARREVAPDTTAMSRALDDFAIGESGGPEGAWRAGGICPLF